MWSRFWLVVIGFRGFFFRFVSVVGLAFGVCCSFVSSRSAVFRYFRFLAVSGSWCRILSVVICSIFWLRFIRVWCVRGESCGSGVLAGGSEGF